MKLTKDYPHRRALLAVGAWVIVAGLGILCSKAPAPPVASNHWATGHTGRSLNLLTTALKFYRQEYGDFPSGDNAAVVRALNGGNPRKMVFLPSPSRSFSSECPTVVLNRQGHAVDAWDTPFRLHLQDRIRVESAGEDRTFGTLDDMIQIIPVRQPPDASTTATEPSLERKPLARCR